MKRFIFFHGKRPPDDLGEPEISFTLNSDGAVLFVEVVMAVGAMKKNNVPVEYIVFPDEGHGFVKKENEIKGYGAVLEFLGLRPGRGAPGSSTGPGVVEGFLH